MESEYLLNSVLHKPSLLQYLDQSASSIPAFPPLTLNATVSDNPPAFDAALTEEFAITELIARLGSIGGGHPYPLHHTIAALSSYESSSSYSTPVDSPHKVNVHGHGFPAGYSSLSRSLQTPTKERLKTKAKPDKSLPVSETENSPAGSSRKRKSSSDDSNSKSVEPPKDYIHVRARRGQATDSHSLAERVRREKISERMKLLQDLVPGCNKVTGKASMLDEIINYVQSLQRQVEFLSMKLASVNTRIDIDTSKDMFHSDNQIFGQDSMIDGISIEQLDSLSQTLSFQLPSFEDAFPPLSNFSQGDLQSIVDMGFVQQTNFNGSLKFER